MRTCIIINPVAGSAGELAELTTHLGRLPGARVMLTTREGDAEQLAREALAQGFRRLVAGGGDGTVNGILNGVGTALAEVELGILPLGTGNDYTASIGMRLPLPEALAALERWHTRPVDVVRVRASSPEGTRERLMLNGSAGGFVSAVGAATDQGTKRGILGSLSYVLTAATSLSDMQPYSLRIRADREELRLEAISTVLTSGRTLGGAVPVDPDALVDDGRVELMVIPPMPLAELAVLGVNIMAGTHTANPALRFFSAARVELDASPPMPVNADGEEVGETPARYEVLPRALRVVVGPSPAAVSPPKIP